MGGESIRVTTIPIEGAGYVVKFEDPLTQQTYQLNGEGVGCYLDYGPQEAFFSTATERSFPTDVVLTKQRIAFDDEVWRPMMIYRSFVAGVATSTDTYSTFEVPSGSVGCSIKREGRSITNSVQVIAKMVGGGPALASNIVDIVRKAGAAASVRGLFRS